MQPTLEYGNNAWWPFSILDQQPNWLKKLDIFNTKKASHHLIYHLYRIVVTCLWPLFYQPFFEFRPFRHCFYLIRYFYRGHHFKLYKPSCTKDVHHHVLNHRVINQWNSLPQDVVNANSTDVLKQLIEVYYSNLYSNSSWCIITRSGITGYSIIYLPAIILNLTIEVAMKNNNLIIN